jgi:hypothetical protein
MTDHRRNKRQDRKAASSRVQNGSVREHAHETLGGLTNKLTPAERREIERIGAYASDEILEKLTLDEFREVVLQTYVPENRERLERGYFFEASRAFVQTSRISGSYLRSGRQSSFGARGDRALGISGTAPKASSRQPRSYLLKQAAWMAQLPNQLKRLLAFIRTRGRLQPSL